MQRNSMMQEIGQSSKNCMSCVGYNVIVFKSPGKRRRKRSQRNVLVSMSTVTILINLFRRYLQYIIMMLQ